MSTHKIKVALATTAFLALSACTNKDAKTPTPTPTPTTPTTIAAGSDGTEVAVACGDAAGAKALGVDRPYWVNGGINVPNAKLIVFTADGKRYVMHDGSGLVLADKDTANSVDALKAMNESPITEITSLQSTIGFVDGVTEFPDLADAQVFKPDFNAFLNDKSYARGTVFTDGVPQDTVSVDGTTPGSESVFFDLEVEEGRWFLSGEIGGASPLTRSLVPEPNGRSPIKFLPKTGNVVVGAQTISAADPATTCAAYVGRQVGSGRE